jgi:hemoglobin
MLKDIENRDDLEELLKEFYTIATADKTIGHHFASLDLESHLPVITDFWDKALFREPVYYGNPLLVHKKINDKNELKLAHFARWVEIFSSTVDRLYAGERAEMAKARAEAMAKSIHRNISGGNPFAGISGR